MRAKSSQTAGNTSSGLPYQLAESVRRQRRVLRLTQVQLANLSGCGPDFIYDLERGKSTLRLDKLVGVLEMLGLTLKVESLRPGIGSGLEVEP